MKTLPRLLITAAMVWTGIVLLSLSLKGIHNRLAGDDFCFWSIANQHTFWGTNVHWWIEWSGRITATLITTIVALIAKQIGGQLAFFTFLSLITLTVAFFVSIRHFFHTTRFQAIWLSLFSDALLFSITPNTAESWYWLSGSVAYLWPIISILFAAVLITRDPGSRRREFAMTPLLILAACGTSASNESFGAIHLALTMSGWSYLLFRNRHSLIFRRLSVYLAISVIVFLIMAIAPGNLSRAKAFPSPMPIVSTLLIALRAGPKLLLVLARDSFPVLLASIPLLLTLPPARNRLPRFSQPQHLLLFCIGTITAISIAYVLPALRVMGLLPPDRSHLTLAFFGLIAFLGCILALRSWPWASRPRLFMTWTVLSILLFLILSIRLTTHIPSEWKTNVNFSRSYLERHQTLLLASQNHATNAVVPPIPFPSGLHWAEIGTDKQHPGWWINICVADAYALPSVQLLGPVR